MLKILKRLFSNRKVKKSVYGVTIFALDDTIHLTRRVTEQQRKQMQQLP